MALNVLPSFRQLIWSVIAGLSSHPKIISPNIFFPVLEGQEGSDPQEIFIERWRTYEGIEVQSPDLTCSVFPFSSSRKSSNNSTATSAVFEPYELGKGQRKATYNLVVQLYYTGVAINNRVVIPYFSVRDQNSYYTPHGTNFFVPDDINLKSRSALLDFHQQVNDNRQDLVDVINKDVLVEINPAEEILREYVDLLRGVLDEIPFILPWKIRSTEVTGYDFPTTSWSDDDPNIFYHTAYLNWSITLYVPSSGQMRTMAPLPDNVLVDEINAKIVRSFPQ